MRSLGVGSSSVDLKQTQDGVYRNRDRNTNNVLACIGGESVAPVAAQYAHVQLLNPVGSGVTLLVDRITVSSDADVDTSLGYYNTQLANLTGSWYAKKLVTAGQFGQIRWESNAATLGTILFPYRSGFSQNRDIVLDDPLLLAEGIGLIVRNEDVNQYLRVAFQGREL